VVPRLTLPDGRTVALDPTTADHLLVGVVVLDGVVVRESPAVWDETAALADRYRAEHAGKQPSEITGLREARELYRAFGMDFTRHRPSSEALLRRVLKGKDLYRINNAVDCCNRCSLEYLLPIGMYDQDLIDGDVTMRVGRAGEEYPGIRKGPVHLTDRLALFDAQGGFGSPTSDSARTCVTGRTGRILAVIMATASYHPDRMREHTEHFAATFARHCEATVVCGDLLGGHA
jgi:DNA/RNA-binding domain of Phe-tRNA-synthetase-like protein